MTVLTTARIAPVEYAVAVDRYLSEAKLSPASRRVYRVSLAGWAWPLVGRPRPQGASRRSAIPPIVPLAVLDGDDMARTLAEAVAARLRQAEVRTVDRELSALRSAIGWWRRREWITADPTATLSGGRVRITGDRAVTLTGGRMRITGDHAVTLASGREWTTADPSLASLTSGRARTLGARQLTDAEFGALLRAPAGLREHAFWRLLRDSGAGAQAVLGLDAHAIDLRGRRARVAAGDRPISWGAATGDLLGWLLAGRRAGPVFLTDRRAVTGTPASDLCQFSGRGRMSYRRAAEIFAEHTRQLDPAGRGWTLHQLRRPPAGGPD